MIGNKKYIHIHTHTHIYKYAPINTTAICNKILASHFAAFRCLRTVANSWIVVIIKTSLNEERGRKHCSKITQSKVFIGELIISGISAGNCANISRGHANGRIAEHDEWNYAQTSCTTISNTMSKYSGKRVGTLHESINMHKDLDPVESSR